MQKLDGLAAYHWALGDPHMSFSRTFRWTYTPTDYFHARISILTDVGKLTFDAGEATLVTPGSHDTVTRADLVAATAVVESGLNARRILVRRPYSLDSPAVVISHPDGTQHYRVYSEARFVEVSSVGVDFVLRNIFRRVIHDSKAERSARESRELEDITRTAVVSSTLRQMLRSYSNALDEPQNALIHLYEVQDAAKKHYGRDAQSRLGIDEGGWKLLGRLANDEPLHEGRHRGRKADSLRHATRDEISAAQHVALSILKAFARDHSTLQD